MPHRSGPAVYGALDQLEQAGWIISRWENVPGGESAPRRRLYRLTPSGAESAKELLTVPRRARVLRSLRPQPTFRTALTVVDYGSAT